MTRSLEAGMSADTDGGRKKRGGPCSFLDRARSLTWPGQARPRRRGRCRSASAAFAWVAGSSPAMTERPMPFRKRRVHVDDRVKPGHDGEGSSCRYGRHSPTHPSCPGQNGEGPASTDPSVMPALEAGIHAITGGAGRSAERAVFYPPIVVFAWMAGSSPAMTERAPAMTERARHDGWAACTDPSCRPCDGGTALRHARP